MIYPPDIKLLSLLKRAQAAQTNYVVIDFSSNKAFAATGYFQEDVNNAISSGIGVDLPFDASDLQISLKYLSNDGLIKRMHAGPVFQVTHDGWYNYYVRKREFCYLLLTNVFFPSLVALVTTLLTLFLTR